MKILFTGATGFIGKYVYNKLVNTNFSIYVISRNYNNEKNNFYKLNILDHKKVKKIIYDIKPDILIHLAWDVTHGQFWKSEKNFDYLKATINLFKAFVDNGGKKIIAAGTCSEYPFTNEKIFEDGNYEGELTPYGYAKSLIYKYLKKISKINEIDFTWCRIFGVFGVGEDKRRFFPSAINSIKKGELFEIKTPDRFFDYVYVDDLASFIVDSITKSGIGAVNIGTGQALAMIDLYKTIENYMKTTMFKTIRTIINPGKNSLIPNCEKLQKAGFNFFLQNGWDYMMS